jgi:hypothetical protein
MKKHALGLFAVVIALAFSAFTTRVDYLYLVYDGSGPENVSSNYVPQIGQPIHVSGSPIQALNWFRVVDADSDQQLDAAEFTDVTNGFPHYDSDSDGQLKDEPADIVGQLDLKNKP